MLPLLILCPTASSRKNRGIPMRMRRMKYGTRYAPERGRGWREGMGEGKSEWEGEVEERGMRRRRRM
jgi:hypothetical protein